MPILTPSGRDAALARVLELLEADLRVEAAVIGPPTFFALRARGLSANEAVRLSVELAVPWLERRRDESADRS